MELKITKEKVLEASEKCSDAKRILETLFPEAFVDKVVIPKFDEIVSSSGQRLIENRLGETDRFWLSSEFSWKIEEARDGGFELIPTKKTK